MNTKLKEVKKWGVSNKTGVVSAHNPGENVNKGIRSLTNQNRFAYVEKIINFKENCNEQKKSIVLFFVLTVMFLGVIAILLLQNEPAIAAERAWHGWVYDGSTYLANRTVRARHVATGQWWQTTTNAQGYYELHVSQSGLYELVAYDTNREKHDYDSIAYGYERHDFDFGMIPH